jgi:hypothetical protein
MIGSSGDARNSAGLPSKRVLCDLAGAQSITLNDIRAEIRDIRLYGVLDVRIYRTTDSECPCLMSRGLRIVGHRFYIHLS